MISSARLCLGRGEQDGPELGRGVGARGEDLALAHVLGLERPEAKGRYLLIKEWASMATLCDELRKIDPAAPVPTEWVPPSPPYTLLPACAVPT